MPRKGPLCSVINCPNSDQHKISSTVFYFVPKDLARGAKWANALMGHVNDVPALANVLICMNHFKPDSFEPDSKKLNNDAVPSIFPFLPRQTRSGLKKSASHGKNVEPPPKRLKVTNTPLPLSRKKSEDSILSKKYKILGINKASTEKSRDGSQMSLLSGIKNKSNLPRLQKHSVITSNTGPSIATQISTVNNKKRYLLEKRKIQNESVHMTRDKADCFAVDPNTNDVSSSLSKVKKEDFVPQASRSQNKSSSPDLKLIDSETDEDDDLQKEILVLKSDGFTDDERTEAADVNEDNNTRDFENSYCVKMIKNLELQKQSLMEQNDKLKKQEQEAGLELQELKEELKRKKALQQDLPDQEKEVLKKCFSSAQIRLLTGQNKSRWSLDDLAMAYTISSLSSREFYTYLRTNLKYPLPAVSNINRCYKSKYRTKNRKNNLDKNDHEKL